MSRAERRTLPPPPRLTTVLRGAISDFYYNSLRFLGANLAVGAILILLLLGPALSAWSLLGAVLLIPVVAGVMRMAVRLVRDGHTDLGDFGEVIRRPWRVLVLGTIQLVLAVVLVGDFAFGASWGSWPGTLLMVSALYGLALLWAYVVVAWPILLDPARDGDPTRRRLRLAAVLLVAHPIRVGTFALVMGVVLIAASIAIAPIATFALSLLWLAIARWVLPAADRVEGRVTQVVEASDDRPAGTSVEASDGDESVRVDRRRNVVAR